MVVSTTQQTSRVTPELRVRAKNIDAALVGSRVREARLRTGLTQGEAAGDVMSTAYLSRIESGLRRASAELLVGLADRLSCDLDELLAPGEDPREALVAAQALELDHAELALRTGSAGDALALVETVLGTTPSGAAQDRADLPVGLQRRARFLRALALEGVGRTDDAVDVLEVVVGEIEGLDLIRALTALTRCYRELGDLGRACEVGERAEQLVGVETLEGCAEGVQLAVTVAAAHHERGDVGVALRTCERAVAVAERLDSPVARASAYWNSSIVHKERGDVEAALPLAQKAIALLEQTHDARNMARLRGQLGLLQLAMDPPELEGAELNLGLARTEMRFSEVNPADRGRVELGLARARLLIGDAEEAERIAEDVLGETLDVSLLVAAEARTVLGQVAALRGHVDEAVTHYRHALVILSGVGKERDAAQLWFELGTLLQGHGAVEEALEAFRQAATSSGLSRPSAVRGRLLRSV